MEELNKCLGCMEDFRGYPCPRCGYDPRKAADIGYALPPQTILHGRYLVGRVLGQGGFGLTYIGWDIPLGIKVAVKEYYPSGQVSRAPGDRTITWYRTEQARQAQQGGLDMFLKEARKMARVESIPGVVKVKDLFQENGTAYIVMDFVEGETLKARLKRTGPMGWDQAREIFAYAIRSMEQVHEKGLIHRDLSPDNLMLTPDGKVEILDLGAAKDTNLSTGASSMQVAKGGFSPLEQYIQRGGSGTWTDVYAMGATIYYTLTGILPPPAVDRMAEDTLSWTVPGLETLPGYALETLKKAMEVMAKNRLQTMEELGQGLFSLRKPAPQPVPQPEQPRGAVTGPACPRGTVSAEKQMGAVMKKAVIFSLVYNLIVCVLIWLGVDEENMFLTTGLILWMGGGIPMGGYLGRSLKDAEPWFGQAMAGSLLCGMISCSEVPVLAWMIRGFEGGIFSGREDTVGDLFLLIGIACLIAACVGRWTARRKK